MLACGCITINFNFPQAEVEDAAEEIIEDVWSVTAEEPEVVPKATQSMPAIFGGIAAAGLLPIPRVETSGTLDRKKKEKKGRIDVDVNDPAIKKIRASLKKRFTKLKPYFDKGALGQQLDGYLASRPPHAELTLKEKRELKGLINAENADRKALYNRIIEASDDIERSDLKRVQAIFGERWIKACKKGWWIQDKEGKWAKKKKKER